MFSTMSARLSRCWMLTVLMTVIPASSRSSTSCQRFSCFGAGRVGVRQLVDQGDGRVALDHRVGVHLFDGHALVRDPLARHDLERRRPVPRCAAGRAFRESR